MHTIWLHTHKQLKPDLKLDSAVTEINGQIDKKSNTKAGIFNSKKGLPIEDCQV